jgi:integrase
VVSPVSSRESWTVVGDDDRTVEPVELYLAYLTGVERSPNTVKAYAHDLKDWFEFLADRELDWRSVVLEDIGASVTWLRTPVQARGGRVAVLPSVAPACSESTVNRKLSALGSFYLHAARNGVEVGDLLASWQVGGSRAGGNRFAPSAVDAAAAAGGVVEGAEEVAAGATPQQVQALLDGCEHLRTGCCWRCSDTGMRIGEVSGCGTTISPPPSGRLRWSAATTTTVPVPVDHRPDGAGECGVGAVVCRLSACRIRRSGQRLRVRQSLGPARWGGRGPMRRSTTWSADCGAAGVQFDPHWIRHTAATRMLRDGISLEVVAKLLGHST